MFKLSKICIKPIELISCQSINKTIIRFKRHTFSRRPLKVLNDSGKDYFRSNDPKESISSSDYEITPNLLSGKPKKKFNKYFDDGFDEDFFDFTENQTNNESNLRNLSKDIIKKDLKKIRDNRNNRSEKEKKWSTNETKERNEKVLKPKFNEIPRYEKICDKNSEFIHLMTTLKQRKRREKENVMLLEGKRLINDAIDANINIKTIFFTKEENLIEIQNLKELVSNGLKLKKILYRDLQLFSELTTSPGIIGVSERPNQNYISSMNELDSNQRLPLILIGDNIRDPGNLGTMIRCGAAVGAQKVVLLKGCADVWDVKVLRSGAGSHFRIPIVADIEWPLVFNHIPIDKPFDLFIADSNGDINKTIGENRKNRHLEIPAHTISTITREVDYITKETFSRDDSYDESNSELIKYRNLSIPSTSYSDVKFFTFGIDRPTVLVIGGETQGLSDQSYKLLYDYIGRKIKIPLALGVDSLNSSIAAAVIMYEMKRQYLSQSISSEQVLENNI